MELNKPRNLYGHILQIKKRYYLHTLEILDESISEFEREYEEATDKFSDEHLEHLADEGGLLQSDLQDTAEILLVSMYHWVETSLKNLLQHSRSKSDLKKKKKINRLNFCQIKESFLDLGTDLEAIDEYKLVDLLRRFTNSWKHEPNRPSRQLLTKLGLSESDDLRGLLSSKPIHEKLNTLFGVEDNDRTSFQLVERALDVCIEFLQATCNRSNFVPDFFRE